MGFMDCGFIKKGTGRKLNYKWEETHTVLEGDDTITLNNQVDAGDVLFVFDKHFGVFWYEGVHWNLNNGDIVFTSNMPIDLDFEVLAFG